MKSRRAIFAVFFVPIFVLLIFVRVVFEKLVAVPLLGLWRQFDLYVENSQPMVWAALVLLIGASAIFTILPTIRFKFADKVELKTASGPIETLAKSLCEAHHGLYFEKWLIANRLGKDAREIVAQREGRFVGKTFGVLTGFKEKPSPVVDLYLNTGLQSSLKGDSNPRWFLRGKDTPLDLDPRKALEYLESEMEV